MKANGDRPIDGHLTRASLCRAFRRAVSETRPYSGGFSHGFTTKDGPRRTALLWRFACEWNAKVVLVTSKKRAPLRPVERIKVREANFFRRSGCRGDLSLADLREEKLPRCEGHHSATRLPVLPGSIAPGVDVLRGVGLGKTGSLSCIADRPHCWPGKARHATWTTEAPPSPPGANPAPQPRPT